MKKEALKQKITIFLCLNILFIMVFSVCIVIAHSDHDCTETNCEICIALHKAGDRIKTLSSCIVLTVIAALIFLEYSYIKVHAYKIRLLSPLLLKVKLNN